MHMYLDFLMASLSVRGSAIGDKITHVVEAYCDESGIHVGSDVCVFAGYVGGYRQFRRLEQRWERLVSILPNSDFHARDFFGRDGSGRRVGPYKNWTDKRARDFLDGLIDAIHSVNVYPRGAIINIPAFSSRDLDERIFLTGGTHSAEKWLRKGEPDKPYFLSYHAHLTECVGFADKNHPLNVFCDQQNQLCGHANEMWLLFQQLNPHFTDRCGPLVFGSRMKIKLLQAADLLASCLYRHQTNPTDEICYAMTRLVEKENKIFDYNEKGIAGALEQFQRPRVPADPACYGFSGGVA